MPRVFVSATLEPQGLEILRNAGVEVSTSAPLNGPELIAALKGVDGLIVRSESQVNAAIFEACPALKVVGRAGTGVDNIDVEAATRAGVVVMNALGGNAVTTAEHAFALLIACARQIPQAHHEMVGGTFNRKHNGTELEGKTLGIVGLGQIGSVLAAKARGFGMEVIGYDPYCTEERARNIGVSLVTLESLLKRADAVSLHVPKTEETANLLDAARMATMKKGALIVNCARGGLIDEAALARALDAGQIGGAALDVYAEEPPPCGHPLVGHPKVVTTPHLGASTVEAQRNVALIIARDIADFLATGRAERAVNLPAMSPQAYAELRPYAELAQCLASFLAQANRALSIRELSLHYGSALAGKSTDFIRRSALVGLLRHQVDTANLVNALKLAEQRGIALSETTGSAQHTQRGQLEVGIRSDDGLHTASGAVTDGSRMRITGYDGFALDAASKGIFLLSRNRDVPGAVGTMGTLLGAETVNIANLQLARATAQGEAMALIEIDAALKHEQLARFAALACVKSVKQIVL